MKVDLLAVPMVYVKVVWWADSKAAETAGAMVDELAEMKAE